MGKTAAVLLRTLWENPAAYSPFEANTKTAQAQLILPLLLALGTKSNAALKNDAKSAYQFAGKVMKPVVGGARTAASTLSAVPAHIAGGAEGRRQAASALRADTSHVPFVLRAGDSSKQAYKDALLAAFKKTQSQDPALTRLSRSAQRQAVPLAVMGGGLGIAGGAGLLKAQQEPPAPTQPFDPGMLTEQDLYNNPELLAALTSKTAAKKEKTKNAPVHNVLSRCGTKLANFALDRELLLLSRAFDDTTKLYE